jgi:hypothetical protein
VGGRLPRTHAIVLANHARLEPAARLTASAEELRQKQGGVRLVHEALGQTRDKLQHTFGPDRLTTELSVGRALTPDDAPTAPWKNSQLLSRLRTSSTQVLVNSSRTDP